MMMVLYLDAEINIVKPWCGTCEEATIKYNSLIVERNAYLREIRKRSEN